jgi:hypothetical protein
VECASQAIDIAHVPDEVAEAGVVEATGAHLMLLELVAAEDDQLLRAVIPKHDLDELFAERSGPTCYENNLILEHAPSQL